MQREIKFRFYDPKDKQMHTQGMKVDFTGNLCVFMGENECPIMQYTGLLDKNGVEIYEGDIVSIQHPCWNENCITEFNNGSFIFKGLNGLSKDIVVAGYTFMQEIWKIEVIGNIYQNPELLK